MEHLTKNHEEKIKVCTYDVDFSKKIRLTALLAYIQETTAQHCNDTTSGREYLWKHGIFWALARIKVEISEMPKLGDDILVRTWPTTHDKIFAYRDYAVWHGGKQLLIGTSDWILMDIHTRRPCRIAKLWELGCLFPEDQEGVIETRPGKIVTKGEIGRSLTRKVSYNDIDMYGHVNNIRYVEWALDTFTASEFDSAKIRSLQINFTAEARDGEEVEITRFEASPGIYTIEGHNLTTEAKTFQMALVSS